MKRSALLFALISSLLFGLIGAVSFAAVKAGATCSKAGAKSVVSNKKFTCIKLGKKLVWDKGVLLNQTKVSSKPTNPAPASPNTSPAIPSEGDSCEKLGNEIKLIPGKLICKYVMNAELKYILEKGIYQPISNITSPNKLDTCKIKDLRTEFITPESIAYPVRPHALINSGVLNWAVVPIDFRDAIGTVPPSELYKSDLKKIDEWLQWYSNGKLRINWILKDEWIRAPLESENYNWIHPGSPGNSVFSPEELMNELAKIGEKNFDYQNIDAVHYFYPFSVTKIYDALTTYSSITTGKISNKGLMNTANGYWLTNPANRQLIWAWMIHEIGHPMGLAGHFPINPYQYGIMQNQGGMGLGLHAWDSLILDWINENQVFCIDSINISGQQIQLVPVEREQAGVRATMIKLSENKVLVVESHKSDKWSFNMPLQNNGVMAFLVDTTKNTYRRDENLEFDAYLDKTAWNIQVDNFSNRKKRDRQLSTIMYLGDSITIEGIRVTFVASGDNDTIEITKV